MPLPREFDLIARHFRPLAGAGALDLLDDAAVFAPPAGCELAVAADAMVEGVHWLAGEDPGLIGRKLLRVNLSDIAAMGAVPFGYLLTISTRADTPDDWYAGFAAGLADDQRRFGVGLLGGDTTSTPGPLSLSLTILGHVAPGAALRRSGAAAGDGIWVTGTIGDGVLGLRVLQGKLADPTGYLAGRYRLPTPRLGLALAGIARAAIDVSDGLVQEVSHLCRASGVAAEIEAGLVPLSPAARAAGPEWVQACLAGGDDYELVLAVPEGQETALRAAAAAADIAVSRIGRFVTRGEDEIVVVRDAAGGIVPLASGGWSHFA